MSTSTPCWSELPNDLLFSIAKRVPFMEDFVAFRGVCVSWRAAAPKDSCDMPVSKIPIQYCSKRSLPKIPMLMLAEKDDESDVREFFHLSTWKMWFKLILPEAKGKRCFESKGWFITVGQEGEMHLLHPFSRVQIELPNISTTKHYSGYEFDDRPHDFIHVVELSCNPFESSDYVVMICGGALALDFWRSGDKVWTRIDFGRTRAFSDITFFNGQFYIIDFMGEIWACDISFSGIPRMKRIAKIDDHRLYSIRKAYLVESSGELLVVFRDGLDMEVDDNGVQDYGATHFDVVHLDLNRSQGVWTVMKSIGDNTIFVGHSSSFSIDSKYFEGTMIKPNCIYFTDDAIDAYFYTGGGKDMGIYHFEDGKIERFPDFQSFSQISPPVFVSPYF